jgi:hypothetical protein
MAVTISFKEFIQRLKKLIQASLLKLDKYSHKISLNIQLRNIPLNKCKK